MDKELPIFNITIDDPNSEEDLGIDQIAFVKNPAIKVKGVAYSQHLQFQDSYNDYPKQASENAKVALRWAEENGWGDCGTAVGKARANQLAKGQAITEDTIARMASFERHRQNSDKELGDGCGRLMWLAWGGDAGVEWAQRKLVQIRKEELAEVGPRGGIKASPKAPKSDTKNPDPKGEGTAKGDAGGKRGAKVSAEQEKTLQGKVDDFNEKDSNTKNGRAALGALKSVFQRGLGAFNTSRSPIIKSAEQWAFARVNAFLYLLKNGRPQNDKYVTDYDLLPNKHPKYIENKNVQFSSIEMTHRQYFEEVGPYYTEDGELWEGPTHKDADGRLMTGDVHTDDSEYLFLDKEGSKDMRFSDDLKYRIAAPAIIPGLIYRNDEDGKYNVQFTEQEIEKIYQKFMQTLNAKKDVFNIEHTDERVPAYILEAMLVDSENKKKFIKQEYNIDIPKGSMFVVSQITDKEYYNEIVKNEQTSYSIEGFLGLIKLSEITNNNNKNKEQMKEKELLAKIADLEAKLKEMNPEKEEMQEEEKEEKMNEHPEKEKEEKMMQEEEKEEMNKHYEKEKEEMNKHYGKDKEEMQEEEKEEKMEEEKEEEKLITLEEVEKIVEEKLKEKMDEMTDVMAELKLRLDEVSKKDEEEETKKVQLSSHQMRTQKALAFHKAFGNKW